MNVSTSAIIEALKQYRDLSLQHWLHYEVFSFFWWLGLAVTIASLLVAWVYIDRKRILEICIFGFFMNIFASFLDVTASEMAVWYYSVRLFPHTPWMFPVDFCIVPVIFMFIYQRYGQWGPFLAVSAVAAAVLSFIIEPLTVYFDIYLMIHWSYFYSWPIYMVIVAAAKAFTHLILHRQQTA